MLAAREFYREVLSRRVSNTANLILCGRTHPPRTFAFGNDRLVVNPGPDDRFYWRLFASRANRTVAATANSTPVATAV